MDTQVPPSIDRLLYQYEDSPNFVALLNALLTQATDLFDSRVQLQLERSLETAIGTQLDGIGAIVGIDRPFGETDDRYRWIVRVKIMINNTDMTIDNTLNLVSYILGGTKVIYTLLNNLAPRFEIARELTQTESDLVHLIPSPLGIAPAIGVVINPVETFSFFDDPTGKGFGDLNNPAVGGNFASLV